MPTKAPLTSIECISASHLHDELASVQDALSCTETEETWEVISRALSRFAALCNGNASTYPSDLVAALRSSSRPINSALSSERTRLSGTATEFMTTSVGALGRAFEPLIPHYLPSLLTLCTRANKVFVTRAKDCIHAVIEHTQSPSILHYLTESAKDKSVSLRLAAAEAVVLCLNSFNPPDLEKEQRAREIEAIIRVTAVDANADVRKVGRKIFDAYKILLPGRVQSFTEPLTPTIRKYLDIKGTTTSRSQPPSRPASSQSVRSGHGESHTASSSRAHPSAATASIAGTNAAVRLTKHTRTVSSSSAAPKRPIRTPTPEIVAPVAPSHDPPRRTREEPRRIGLARLDMPPPDYIPSRPVDGGSQRPLSATEMYFPHHASERPATGPQRVALVDGVPPSTSGTAVRSGPIRPVMMSMKPVGGEDGAEKKERVIGGARRVLRLPETSEATVAASEDNPKEKAPSSKPIRPRVISTSQSTPAVPSQAASTAAKAREDALKATKLASSQGPPARSGTGSSAAAASAAGALAARHARTVSGGLHSKTASARARVAEKAQEKEKDKATGAKSRVVSSLKAAVPSRAPAAAATTVTVRDRSHAASTAKSSAGAAGTKHVVKEGKALKTTGTKALSRAGTQEPPSRAQSVAPADVPLPESPKADAQTLPQGDDQQTHEPAAEEHAAALELEGDLIDLRSAALEPGDIPLPSSGSEFPSSDSSSSTPASHTPIRAAPPETEADTVEPEAKAEVQEAADARVSCTTFLAATESEAPVAAHPTASSLPFPRNVEEAHTPEQQRMRRVAVEQTPISALVASIERGFLSMRGVPLSPMREEAEDENSILVGVSEECGADVDPDGKVFDEPEPVQPLFLGRSRSVVQHV